MNIRTTSWQEAAEQLAADHVGVMPTDTVYGIVGRAHSRDVVARIYSLRRRDLDKPLITLVSDLSDLEKFGVVLDQRTSALFSRAWSHPVSIIVAVPDPRYAYIHRGTQSIAFRVVRHRELANLIQRVGPLVAPSANLAGDPVARTIEEAYVYFGDEAFYVDGGHVVGAASAVVDARGEQLKVLRLGPGFDPTSL